VIRYENFDLRIGRQGKGYKVEVLNSPDGQAEGRLRNSVVAEVEKRFAELVRSISPGASPKDSRRFAEQLGRILHREVFAGAVATCFEVSRAKTAADKRGLRLRLRLSGVPRVSALPWEYLAEPRRRRFLALSASTPIVRYLEFQDGVQPLRISLPLTVLVAIAAPLDLPRLDADREWSRIQGAFSELADRVVLERLEPATLEALGERLHRGDVHILHFVGHGGFDRASEEGALSLENQRRLTNSVTATQLAGALFGRGLQLVVLNACEGAKHGATDAFSGVAQCLVQQGVPAVVAMQLTISNLAAITFAESFYTNLAQRAPVDAAVAEARRAVDLKHQGVPFGAPVLHLRAPDGDLFEVGEEEQKASESAPAPAAEPGSDAARLNRHKGRRLALAAIAAAVLTAGGITIFRGGAGFRAESLVAGHERVQPTGEAPPEQAPQLRSEAIHPSRPRAEAAPPDRPPVLIKSSRRCPSPKDPEILFKIVEPGSFVMGSADGDENERPPHPVRITQPFCMSAYEVTVGQWDAVMGDGSSIASGSQQRLPKVGIRHFQTLQFAEKLTAKNPGRMFFLPTEAQWEYAARAGSSARYSFGDDPAELYHYANCRSRGEHDDGYDGLAPVGIFQANAWGLFDMQGNVQEWVADFYGDYSTEPAVDPHGPAAGMEWVRRGGSWDMTPAHCRPTTRRGSGPDYHHYNLGFRIAATPLQ